MSDPDGSQEIDLTRIGQVEGRTIFFVSIIALTLFRLFHQSLKFLLQSNFIDLAYHHFYSTIIRMGLDPFNPEHIELAKTLNPIRFAGGGPVYTPSYFFFFQPLTHMPFTTLSTIWLIMSLILVIASITILLRHQEWDRSWLVLTFVVLVVATYQPLYEDLALGQNNTILLILCLFTWYGLSKKNLWITSLSLAILPIIKIQYLFLIGFFLIIRYYRVALISSLAFLVLFFAPLPQLGISYYRKYLDALVGHTTKVSTDIHNISFNGQIHRILGNEFHQATLVYLVISLVLFGLILRWYYRYSKGIDPGFILLLGVTLIPLLSPHTEEHHLVPILLPLIYVTLSIASARSSTKWLYLAGVVLIVSRYSWVSFSLPNDSLLNLLLSLKCFGVLFMLLVLIRLQTEKTMPPAADRLGYAK